MKHGFVVTGGWYTAWPCPESTSIYTPLVTSGVLTGNIDFDWGGGNVKINNNDSGLRDYVVVKLTGQFTMPGTSGLLTQYISKIEMMMDLNSKSMDRQL